MWPTGPESQGRRPRTRWMPCSGAIAETLARGEDVQIVGFGTFGTRSRPARTGRNPRTGESLNIAASTMPTFKAGKPLRDAVNAGGS